MENFGIIGAGEAGTRAAFALREAVYRPDHADRGGAGDAV